jgi:(R)-2-hydroxyacyl-CoA dehydratese activating ATPase
MITAGCDIGSLTAKAAILDGDRLVASHLMRVRGRPQEVAEAVMAEAARGAGLERQQINRVCSTGYGRFDIPFATMNRTEIACHAMGAFFLAPSVRTVIDIGGQDCKVMALDDRGGVTAFSMNDKCAAGTGRCLELLAKALGVGVEELGPLSHKARRELTISNKCSIFMELEVLEGLSRRRKVTDLARAINAAVARRAVQLAHAVRPLPAICLTGGVAKNTGVARALAAALGQPLATLPGDPQLAGAIGAAVLARSGEDIPC